MNAVAESLDIEPRTVDANQDPRCSAVSDVFEGPELEDLDVYAEMVEEFRATSAVDVGCGTGTFATMLAARGIDVVAVDPSAPALVVARTKPNADEVQWIHGTAPDLPVLQSDMAFMTANVAQEFLADEEWAETLDAIHSALRPGGRLVFEPRDPERRAWAGWTKEQTYSAADIEGQGRVESWVQLESVDGDFVSFLGVTVFGRDGARVDQPSTLRFRSRDKFINSLEQSGFIVDEVRDAPDRPRREFVFVVRKV